MAIQLPNLFAHSRPSKALALVGGAFAGSVVLGLSLTAPANAAAGLSFSSSGVISDRLDLQQQRVIANIWSTYLVPVEASSRFISDATPPAPGRRVIIRNVTQGLSSEPFSDRAYDNDLGSELILLKPGRSHETKTFTVIPGQISAPLQNTFRYEIRENDGTVLESSEFSLRIGISDKPISTIYRQQRTTYPTHGYVPNYYDEYDSYGYGGYRGRRRSIYPRSHFRRQLRQYRHHRR